MKRKPFYSFDEFMELLTIIDFDWIGFMGELFANELELYTPKEQFDISGMLIYCKNRSCLCNNWYILETNNENETDIAINQSLC